MTFENTLSRPLFLVDRLDGFLRYDKVTNSISRKPSVAMTKNFGLSHEDFNILRAQLMNDDQTLFKHIFYTHFEDCRIFLMRKYSCTPEDAYDATMNTLVNFRKKIIEGKIEYDNLRFLFTRMAGQNLMEEYKVRKKQNDVIEVESKDFLRYEKNMTTLEIAYDKLGDGCRDLLKKFYYDKVQLKHIAKETNTSYVSLRKQKERCILRLRTLFMQYSTNDSNT